MSGSALHIMVVVEPDRATYLDWPSLRREAVERGAMISLLEISESGPRWVVPVGPPGEGAEVPAVARDSGTVATGSGPAIIGKAFEAQASAPTIQTTEIRLLGGEPIERELASSLKKVAAISMTVFDNGAFRPSRSADPAPAPIQARDAPGMMPPPPPPPVPAGESSPGAVAQARTAPAAARGRTGLRRGRLWAMLAAGLAAAVVASIVAYFVFWPRYPDTYPLGPSDLDSLVVEVTGQRLEAHVPDTENIKGTSPSVCGVLAQIGVGMIASSDLESKGPAHYQVMGDLDGSDKPWADARLFDSPERAGAFVDEMAAAVPSCGTLYRPNDRGAQWAASELTRSGDTIRFLYGRTDLPNPLGSDLRPVVVKRYENAVFLLLFDNEDEDPSYADRIPSS